MSPSLYLSGFLEKNKDSYYQHLENISKNGDWFSWMRYFLDFVIHQSEANLVLIRRIINLYEEKKREISDLLRSDQSIYILDMLFDKPVFCSKRAT